MNSLNCAVETDAQRARDWIDELAEGVSHGCVVRRDEILARHTTLRVGGPADLYIEPASEEDLGAILKFCSAHDRAFLLIGRGSNLLVRDGGYRGVVISLAHPVFGRITVEGERVRCGAGAKLKQVAGEARKNGLAGLEFLEGIPGSVGGGLRMNAGAMGGALFDAVEKVRIMDFQGQIRECGVADLSVEYRSCDSLRASIALETVLRGLPDSQESISQRMIAYRRKRWSSQPAAPSAGCMFKNPPSIPAGRLIDELGLKGTRLGGARVSMEHGNFIVNDGSATARDVLELIAMLQERARQERGIELRTEVEIVGED